MSPPQRGRLWRALRPAGEGALLAWGAATARWRRPPDFLVIGGRRCGTTTLFYGLLQHPSVIPQILSAGWLPLAEHRKGTRWLDRPRPGGRWYRAHFASDPVRRRYVRRTGGAVTGEATPWYLAAPGAAERAHTEAPDARLVVSLRDPVARAHSQFVEQRARGHEALDDFEAALTAEDERRRVGAIGPDGRRLDPAFATEHLTYRYQSEYDTVLTPWLQRYPRDRLLVLEAEQVYADVAGTLTRVAEFLELPPFEFAAEHRNAQPSAGPDDAVATELRARLRPHVEALEELLGQRFSWPR